MLAAELTPEYVDQTIVVGSGTKRRRGVIQQVFNASTYTRVVFESNGSRSIVLPLHEEVVLEI